MHPSALARPATQDPVGDLPCPPSPCANVPGLRVVSCPRCGVARASGGRWQRACRSRVLPDRDGAEELSQELHSGMHDITERVAVFRETARHVWNTAFCPTDDWNDADRFDAVYKCLFEALVLAPMGIDGVGIPALVEVDPVPIEYLHVRANDAGAIPIHVNRTSPSSGYWDDPVGMVEPANADLRFAGFFDFVSLDRREFRYFQVVLS